jgi:hypothetical protein
MGMGNGDNAFHISGDGIANFTCADNGRKNDDVVSHAHSPIRSFITEKPYFIFAPHFDKSIKVFKKTDRYAGKAL